MVLLDETKNNKRELVKAWKGKVDIINFQPDFRYQKGHQPHAILPSAFSALRIVHPTKLMYQIF